MSTVYRMYGVYIPSPFQIRYGQTIPYVRVVRGKGSRQTVPSLYALPRKGNEQTIPYVGVFGNGQTFPFVGHVGGERSGQTGSL